MLRLCGSSCSITLDDWHQQFGGGFELAMRGTGGLGLGGAGLPGGGWSIAFEMSRCPAQWGWHHKADGEGAVIMHHFDGQHMPAHSGRAHDWCGLCAEAK